jgi:hypothetical protein
MTPLEELARRKGKSKSRRRGKHHPRRGQSTLPSEVASGTSSAPLLAAPKLVSTQIRSFPAATSDFFLEHLNSPRMRLAHLMKSAGSSHSAPAPLQGGTPLSTARTNSDGFPSTESIPSPNPPPPILAGKEYSSDEMGDAVRPKKKKPQKSENVSSILRYFHATARSHTVLPTAPSSNPYALLEEHDEDNMEYEVDGTRASPEPRSLTSWCIKPDSTSNTPVITPSTPSTETLLSSSYHHNPTPCNTPQPDTPLLLSDARHTPRCSAPPYSFYNPFKHGQQNQWCGTTNSGQIAMALRPDDIDRLCLLPPPHRSLYHQLLDDLLHSSELHIAAQPGCQDFSITPGNGVCALAALVMISHSMASSEESIYPVLDLGNLSHRKFLRSLTNRLNAKLMTHCSPLAPELRRSLPEYLQALPTTGPIKPLPSAQYLPSDLFLLAANALSLPVALWSSHHDPDRSTVLPSWAILEGTSDEFPTPPQMSIQSLTSFLSQAHHVILRHNHYYVMRPENIARDLIECLQSLRDKISSQALQHELRHRHLTPSQDSSLPSDPHLPSSSPHELSTGQQLSVYTEPLTVIIPSSSPLQKVMEEANQLLTPEQYGPHLQVLLQSEPIFHLHTTLSPPPPTYSRANPPLSAYLVLFHVNRSSNQHNRCAYSPNLTAPDHSAFTDFLLSLTKLPDLSPHFVNKLVSTHRHFASNASPDMLLLSQAISPPEFRSLLSHINPNTSMWASFIPPRIQLWGAPCPSPFSPLGVNAARMRTLLCHPSIIFHDSGYSLFPLPFRQSQIESSIALHHNTLLASLSNCAQWTMPHPPLPHPFSAQSSLASPSPPTSNHTHRDCDLPHLQKASSSSKTYQGDSKILILRFGFRL